MTTGTLKYMLLLFLVQCMCGDVMELNQESSAECCTRVTPGTALDFWSRVLFLANSHSFNDSGQVVNSQTHMPLSTSSVHYLVLAKGQ